MSGWLDFAGSISGYRCLRLPLDLVNDRYFAG
jgi:hypothetical protein